MNTLQTLASAVVLISSAAVAVAEPKTYGGVFAITEPVGSMLTINVQSNVPSSFRGSFAQSFVFSQSIQNPIAVTSFNRNFTFSGTSNYNIVSQINNNVTTFTNWNFNR
jgi:hypothetical protein